VAKRRYRIVHEPYLIEWLSLNFPPGTWRTNVTLGKVKVPERAAITPEEYAMLRETFGGQADAIIFLEDKTIIVEAMVRHEPGSVEDLLRYKQLLLTDPEFKDRWSLPVRLVLLTPLELGERAKFAAEQGVEVIHYRPPWIWEYIHSYPKRWRRARGYSTTRG
jgi:hypothetical protein